MMTSDFTGASSLDSRTHPGLLTRQQAHAPEARRPLAAIEDVQMDAGIVVDELDLDVGMGDLHAEAPSGTCLQFHPCEVFGGLHRERRTIQPASGHGEPRPLRFDERADTDPFPEDVGSNGERLFDGPRSVVVSLAPTTKLPMMRARRYRWSGQAPRTTTVCSGMTRPRTGPHHPRLPVERPRYRSLI